MPLILDVLVALGLATAFAGSVQLWRRSLAAGRMEDVRALAARRGWSVTVTEARLGRAGALRLASRGGHAWALEVRPDGGGAVTEYLADEPRWPQGTLIALAAQGQLDPRSVRRALGSDLSRLGASLTQLPSMEGLLLLADADPARRMILQDLGRALSGWGGPGMPIVVLSPEGLRLRLRAPIARADRMERFVDLAFDLSRVIGP